MDRKVFGNSETVCPYPSCKKAILNTPRYANKTRSYRKSSAPVTPSVPTRRARGTGTVLTLVYVKALILCLLKQLDHLACLCIAAWLHELQMVSIPQLPYPQILTFFPSIGLDLDEMCGFGYIGCMRGVQAWCNKRQQKIGIPQC